MTDFAQYNKDRAEVELFLRDKYPNLAAILSGTVSGHYTDWPMIQPELVRLVKTLKGEQ